MSPKEKIIFLAVIPLAAASLAAGATYLAAPAREQVIVTGEAAKAAKDGKLTVEIVRKDESDPAWPIAFAAVGIAFAFALIMWAASRSD